MKPPAKGMHDPATVRSGSRVPSYIWTGVERSLARVVRPSGIKPNWHLIYTTGGSGSFRQPGFELTLAVGDLILFPPDCYQDYGSAGAVWENCYAHFAPRPNWHAWMHWPVVGTRLHHVHLPPGPIRDGVRDAMERCHRYAHSSFSSFAHELALSALEEAILLGAHESCYGRPDGDPSPAIAEVVSLIASDLSQRHSVRSLARRVGLSTSRFAHLFKQETGESVIAYINRLRIREAARLLEAEGMSVKAVAAAVGYQSPFYFSRQFRRFYLIDPSSFRRSTTRLMPRLTEP